MSHHLDGLGRFQSDKFPDLAPDKIVVSFKDRRARRALFALARGYEHTDEALAKDIRERLATIVKEPAPADA